MPDTSSSTSHRVNRRVLVHSVRTAVAAVASLVVARALGLPEAYWATITTLIIMQSTLGAALDRVRTALRRDRFGCRDGRAADDLLRVEPDRVRLRRIRNWIDLRGCVHRGRVPVRQRYSRDCHARSPYANKRGSSRLTGSSKSRWE